MQCFSDNGRHSMRCPGRDYSRPGFYFITICTRERECLFGEIKNGKMILNEAGMAAQNEWLNTPVIRRNVSLDEFIIMPNHLHGIIVIKYKIEKSHPVGVDCNQPLQNDECGNWRRQSNNLPAIIRGFKGASTVKINSLFQEGDRAPVWQRNFYDHIIHGNRELFAVKNYIKSNPATWQNDLENFEYIKSVSGNELSQRRNSHYSNCDFV